MDWRTALRNASFWWTNGQTNGSSKSEFFGGRTDGRTAPQNPSFLMDERKDEQLPKQTEKWTEQMDRQMHQMKQNVSSEAKTNGRTDGQTD